MKRRNYESIAELLYSKALGLNELGGSDWDDVADEKCFNNHCDLTKTMADVFEKEDENFKWRDFMSTAGCFGQGKKKMMEQLKKRRGLRDDK